MDEASHSSSRRLVSKRHLVHEPLSDDLGRSKVRFQSHGFNRVFALSGVLFVHGTALGGKVEKDYSVVGNAGIFQSSDLKK